MSNDEFGPAGPLPPDLQQIFDEAIERQRSVLEGDGMFVLREFLSLIPKDHSFTLPSGAIARLMVFVSPIMRDGAPYAMVDAKISGGPCDHFGFAIRLTDHGGGV